MGGSGLALPLIFVGLPVLAGPPALVLPLDCSLGQDCYVQNYVDRAPGPGARDVACRHLTYDGHKGTDFALTSFEAMEQGVAVFAAAPGTVRATRDGMPDLGLAGTPPEELANRDCGNGIVIDHADGWQTQYCHLRRGSVSVKEGEEVAAGQTIGAVGYSGRSEFPHVHLSLRHDGAVIDPFDIAPPSACAGDPEADLPAWAGPVPYSGSGLIALGVASEVPGYDEVQSGAAGHGRLPASAPALVGWAFAYGTRAGDRLAITLTDPTGAVAFEHEASFERDQARAYRAAGRKARGDWQAGIWRLDVRLLSEGGEIDHAQTEFQIIE